MTDELVLVRQDEFELDQRRAKAYAQSGYWPDASDIAKALVKIEAGRSLGLPPIVAMSEIHVIEGKPTLGAGALAALVKASGRYDYRVVELNNDRCAIRFYDRAEKLEPVSEFTMDDAKAAGLLNKGPWRQYPRNMLFARAISNGVAWHCPDVTSGRIYTPEELDLEPIVRHAAYISPDDEVVETPEPDQDEDDDELPEPVEPDEDEPEYEFKTPPGVQTPLG
jgi:hypothetical protein